MNVYLRVRELIDTATGRTTRKNNKKSFDSSSNERESIQIGAYKVMISDNVLSLMGRYIQDTSNKNESGGILLGSIIGKAIYVARASVPNKSDKASRFGFLRDKDIAQVIVDYEFENSDGKMFYLGEWHTHPEDYPKPSPQDRNMTIEQFNKSTLTKPFSLVFIQGIKGIYVALYDGKNIIEPK